MEMIEIEIKPETREQCNNQRREFMSVRELLDKVIELNVKFLEKQIKGEIDHSFRDPDTILADLMDDQDFEVNGTAIELFSIYRDQENGHETFNDMFRFFTGKEFEDYLKECKEVLEHEIDQNQKSDRN